jgi:hypoxanthine phosphoribosyltransferase
MSKTYITWENIQQDTKILANKLSKFNFSCIIGVANGGMIPATLIAKELKVNKLLSCNLKSYQEDKPREGAHSQMDVVKIISFPDWRSLREEDRVLILDDLVDTGLTLKKIIHYNNIINHNQPEKNWIFATLYNKPRSIFKPDYTVREFDNDEWIVFPWES